MPDAINKMNFIKSKFKEIQIELSERQAEQFLMYYEMLVETNKVMNLTAITEFEEVVLKHFIDSVTLPKDYIFENMKLIDIGTGAGFPGIPLKIVYPEIEVVLLDSLNKRIGFLNDVMDKLGLKKIIAVHGRAEDYAKQTQYREQFDLCVSRAVAKLVSLSEYCIPFVKRGGFFISYKATDIESEVKEAKKAIHILGGGSAKVEKFELIGTDMKRCFVMIKKESPTNCKYPRSAGKPTKEPLM